MPFSISFLMLYIILLFRMMMMMIVDKLQGLSQELMIGHRIAVATMNDLQVLAKFTVDMIKQSQDMKTDPNQVTASYQKLMKNSQGSQDSRMPEHGIILLKFVDEEPIGMLRVFPKSKNSVLLRAIYVRPQNRRQGHFKSMFEYTVQLVKEKGFKSLGLAVHEVNYKAKEMYVSFGMKPHPDKYYVFDKNSEDLNDIGRFKMEKDLSQEEAEVWCKQKVNLLKGQEYSFAGEMRFLMLRDGEKGIGYASYFYFLEHLFNQDIPYITGIFVEESYQRFIQQITADVVKTLKESIAGKKCTVTILTSNAHLLKGGIVEPYDFYALSL